MSKGSNRRPTNEKKYVDNWERIFEQKETKGKESPIKTQPRGKQ